MTLAVTEDELRQRLVDAPFINHYGFQLHAVGPDTCTLAIPYRTAWERPGGIVSGPILMAAADVAMWFAIMTRLGQEAEMTLTIEMTTAFLSAAIREEVLCNATVLKVGRQVVYGTVESRTGSGNLVAHHTLTYMRPRAPAG